MTSPNSILDGRSTDPGSQPQSYVTGQIGRKQKAAYEPENADHKLDSSDFFKVQDPSCLECKKRRLNCKGGGPTSGDCKHCLRRVSDCVWTVAGGVRTPRLGKAQSSDDDEGPIRGNGAGKINSTDLAVYSLSRYLLSKVEDSTSRSVNAPPVEEGQARLGTILPVVQPGSHNPPNAGNSSRTSSPSTNYPFPTNPFVRRVGENATLAFPISISGAISPAVAEATNRSTSDLSEGQVRPSDIWLRTYREAQLATTSSTPLATFSSTQQRANQNSSSVPSRNRSGSIPEEMEHQSSDSLAVEELRDEVKRLWQEIRSATPNPSRPFQAYSPDTEIQNATSASRNPFYLRASRAPTPSPLSRTAEMISNGAMIQLSLSSDTSSAATFHENQQRANDNSTVMLEDLVHSNSTPKPSAIMPTTAESSVPQGPDTVTTEMIRFASSHSGETQSVVSDETCRTFDMSGSPLSEGRYDSVRFERSEDDKSQACSSENQSWPEGIRHNVYSSSQGAFTPSTPSKSSDNSSVRPRSAISTEFELLCENEELFDDSEDGFSQTADGVSNHDDKSKTGGQPEDTEQSIRQFFSTRYANGLVNSRPTDSSSRPTKSTRSAHSSTTSAVPTSGNSHGGHEISKQLSNKENLEDNSDDDNDGDKRRRIPKGKSGSPPTPYPSEKLVCPYYARAPLKPYNRSCYGPGWETAHRVKEHVYRVHPLRPYCPRCWAFFEDEEQLNTHLQKVVDPCAIKPLSFSLSGEGFDKRQEKELRRRVNKSQTEEERWGEMYYILFPDDGRSSIPDPYHGAATPFDQYMRGEMPRQYVREITTFVQQHCGPITPAMRDAIACIPKRADAEARQSYHAASLAMQAPGESSQGIDGADVPLYRKLEHSANNDGRVSAIAVGKRKATSSGNQSLAAHTTQPQTTHARLTSPETTQTITYNRGRNQPEAQTRRNSEASGAFHAQHQQEHSMPGRNQEALNWQSSTQPHIELPSTQGYFTQPQLVSNFNYRPASNNLGPAQPSNWNDHTFQMTRPATTSCPPGYTPYPRPESTPPIPSTSHYGTWSNMNGPSWTSPPSAVPFANTNDHQTFHTPNIRRNSFATPQPTQGYFSPLQPNFTYSQPMIPDQHLFSAHPQNFDVFASQQQQFNMLPPQPYLSARGQNPFGAKFAIIDEDADEQKDEPDYEGVGQMDQSF